MQSGGEVSEDPPGGGAGAWTGLQTIPSKHPLTVHGPGLSHRSRG